MMPEEKVIQKFPSTSHYDKQGRYIPCPINTPFAYQDSGAQPIANHKHPTRVSGYCSHRMLGGCEKD
jgi:hypothetical protein